MTPTESFEAATYHKVDVRIVPFLFLCYILAYLDRVNVGFAKLQMLKDLSMRSRTRHARRPRGAAGSRSRRLLVGAREGLRHRLNGGALLVGQVGGHDDVDGDEEVARGRLGVRGHAAAPDPQRRAARGPRRDAHRHVAVERLDGDVRAERGVGKADGDPRREAAALAPEARVTRDVHDDVEVPGCRAVLAGLALALHADALASLHARGDPHLDRAAGSLAAGPVARRARRLDPRAAPLAHGTDRGQGEHALVVVEHTPTVA